MKYSIDINILLYATDSDSPFHAKAREFLDNQIGEGDCHFVWDTLYGFLRISTHPGIFKNPLPPKIALENVRSVCDALGATVLAPDETSWEIFVNLSQRLAIKGKLVPDAVIASVLEANGISKIFTHDRDFWRFPALRPSDPIG